MDKKYNEDLFYFCKTSSSNVRIYYVDSIHGITELNKHLEGDTLVLNFKIEVVKKQVNPEINIENLNFIKVGRKIINISEIKNCRDN